MSTPPQETETRTVDLSREERWVVHHVLVGIADEAVETGSAPPAWVADLVETIESNAKTITRRQATNLHDELTTYATDGETPDRDVEPALAVRDTLENAFDL